MNTSSIFVDPAGSWDQGWSRLEHETEPPPIEYSQTIVDAESLPVLA